MNSGGQTPAGRLVNHGEGGISPGPHHQVGPELVQDRPGRGDFFKYTKAEAREKLGFSDERPLILSYWGSLGSGESW